MIYSLWLTQTSQNWKHDANEVESAWLLIKEAEQQSSDLASNKGLHMIVEAIDVPEEPGFMGIAFALTDTLQKWGGLICKVSLDSACM